MLIYSLSCVIYLILTRGIRTPFHNSLTMSQLLIKKESSKKRKNIFILSIVLSSIGLFYLKPFSIYSPQKQNI
jgi:hypothetical protein